LTYYDRRFPIAPPTWPVFLDLVLENLPADAPAEVRTELASITTQLRRLPPTERDDAESVEERYREQDVARRRLRTLMGKHPVVGEAIEVSLGQFNGQPDDPRSWDRLEDLLQHQHYRLAFWRVAV